MHKNGLGKWYLYYWNLQFARLSMKTDYRILFLPVVLLCIASKVSTAKNPRHEKVAGRKGDCRRR